MITISGCYSGGPRFKSRLKRNFWIFHQFVLSQGHSRGYFHISDFNVTRPAHQWGRWKIAKTAQPRCSSYPEWSDKKAAFWPFLWKWKIIVLRISMLLNYHVRNQKKEANAKKWHRIDTNEIFDNSLSAFPLKKYCFFLLTFFSIFNFSPTKT